MPANAGNSFNTAGDLNPSSISQTFIDSVNPSNLNDFYRFNLGSAGYINLSLKGASGNVDLQLIQDLNNNGRAETREILGRSALGGTASDAISVALAPGTYYVQVYANSRVTTNYSLNWSATSLGSTNYTDPTSVKSYFGTEVTRSFFNGRGISTYQTQVGNFLMYGAIADYYTNTYFNNPNSSNGLFGIYSGLGLPTSPIYKQSDGSFVMDFEGGTLINRNGIVTPSYSHRGGDRFDLVGQGAPDGYELQWKNDHSWFSAKSVGQPTGAVRRVNNGWVQEFTGSPNGDGDSVFLLRDGQAIQGGFEKYIDNFSRQIDRPKGGPYRIQGGILAAYRLAGGYERAANGLGFPTFSAERSDVQGYKAYQAFENGFIGLTYDGKTVIQNWQGKSIGVVGYDGTAIHSTYVNTFNRNGGRSGLGDATNTVHPWGSGYAQDFTGGTNGQGTILKSNANDNSYWVGSDFWRVYLQVSGADGLLKYPTSDRYSTNGGWRQDFQGGAILKSAQGGAFSIYGGIGGKYLSLGAQNSFLGFPTSGEIGIGDGWIVQNFEGGSIFYKQGQPTIAYDNRAINGLPADSGHGSTASWFVQFWNNQNQSGNPVWSRTDPAGEIRFAAGVGAPVNTRGVQEDHFSARWTTRSYFDGGFYDFVSQADDGIRISIDGIRVLDKWQDQPFVRNDAYVLIPKGFHNIQVDYFENSGAAANTLRWDALGQASNWTGALTVVGFDGSTVHSTYINTFKRDGGASVIGAPSNNVHPWGNGYVQDFSGGSEGRGIIMKSNANDNSYWVGSNFWNAYYATGGAGGILGYATSDRYSANGGSRQDFQGGAILQSSRGTFTVFGGVGYQYLHFEGGQKGRLGFPTSGEIGVGNGAIIQYFEKGYILYGRGATRTVINGSEIAVGYDGAGVNTTYTNTFDRTGGWDVVGSATNNVHRWGSGYVQDFSGGSEGSGIIMKSDANNNSYWIGGSFWNKFLETGGSEGILGYPTSDRYATNGGFRQDFQGGAIFQSSKGTVAAFGGVGYQYLHYEGGQKGRLGFPTSSEIGIGNGAIVQNFENGYILYGRGVTRTVINGAEIAIGYDGAGVNSTFTNTFERVGGWDAIGSASNNVHRWENGYTQDFVGGSEGRGAIMKSNANNNSYWVGGDFWNKFLETGGAGGILGYATSNRYSSGNALRQDFQGGSIFKTSRGVFTLYGGIGSYYFKTAGGEKGRLGLPTSGEQGIGNGIIRQNFENGYILWNGTVTAYKSDGSLLFPVSNPNNGEGGSFNETPLFSNPTSQNPLKGFRHPLLGAGSVTQGPGGSTSHSGRAAYAIDFGVPIGTSVHTMRSGKVVAVRDIYPDTGGGAENANKFNYVLVEHDGGYRSAYLHLQQGFNSRVGLKVGDSVVAGQLIGYSGNSGWSTGPHLHVEVHKPNSNGSFGQTVPFEISTLQIPSDPGDSDTGDETLPIPWKIDIDKYPKVLSKRESYFSELSGNRADEAAYSFEEYKNFKNNYEGDTNPVKKFFKGKDNLRLEDYGKDDWAQILYQSDELKNYAKAIKWDIYGWDDAAELLRYYLSNEGGEKKIDVDELLRESKTADSKVMFNENKQALIEAAKEEVKGFHQSGKLIIGFQGSGDLANLTNPLQYNSGDINWQLALGNFEFSYVADFAWIPTGDVNSRSGNIKVTTTLNIFDVYNFEFPYVSEQRLHNVALAKNFYTVGFKKEEDYIPFTFA